MKKSTFLIILILFSNFLKSQTPEEQKYLDTLKLGGTYLVGKKMPEFCIHSTNGKEFTNKSLKGKITVINFWFEACAPCIAEMDALVKLFGNFTSYKKFQFLSITYEKNEAIKKVVEKYNLTYPILSTSIDSCHNLNFKKGFPTTIIIDKEGEIVYFSFGGDTNPEKINLFFKTNIYPLLKCLLTSNL